MLTKTAMENIVQKSLDQARTISGQLDHRNWFPCGNAHILAPGNGELIRFLKKTPISNVRIMKAEVGYWVSLQYPTKDAFESQNMDYAIKVHQAFCDELSTAGVKNVFVDYYID